MKLTLINRLSYIKFLPIHWTIIITSISPEPCNSHVEGWHSRVKEVSSKLHPNIYTWIERTQREDQRQWPRPRFRASSYIVWRRRRAYRPSL